MPAAPEPASVAGWMAYVGAVSTFVVPPLLAAALSGYLVGRWKARGDYLEKRLDDLCAMIDQAADFSAEYWSVPQSDLNAPLAEAKVTAQLMKISGLRALAESNMSGSSARELAAAEAVFFREATCGNFGVHNRTADIQQLVAIRHAAAQFVVAIRSARMADLKGMRQRG